MMAKKRKVADRYHYKECGLDNIYLLNGFEYVDLPRGRSVRVLDMEGLHRAIGEILITEKKKLNGKEFRFLRHELNTTQASLGLLLSVDAQTIAHWEKDKNEISGPAQGLIRLLYAEKISGNRAICEPLERLADMDELLGEDEDIDFEKRIGSGK